MISYLDSSSCIQPLFICVSLWTRHCAQCPNRMVDIIDKDEIK